MILSSTLHEKFKIHPETEKSIYFAYLWIYLLDFQDDYPTPTMD